MIGGGPRLSRRHFLVHGGLAAFAGVVAGCAPSTPSAPPPAASSPSGPSGGPLAPVDRGPVGGMEPLHAIGHAWFAEHPEDGDADDLGAALGVSATATDIRSHLGDLAPRIRDDFAAGRTVALDGWRLAETEVRLATLVWLLEGAPAPA